MTDYAFTYRVTITVGATDLVDAAKMAESVMANAIDTASESGLVVTSQVEAVRAVTR